MSAPDFDRPEFTPLPVAAERECERPECEPSLPDGPASHVWYSRQRQGEWFRFTNEAVSVAKALEIAFTVPGIVGNFGFLRVRIVPANVSVESWCGGAIKCVADVSTCACAEQRWHDHASAAAAYAGWVL